MITIVLLTCLGLISLLAEIVGFKKLLYPLVLIGLVITTGLTIMQWDSNETYFNMVHFNNYAIIFSTVILIAATLWFILAKEFLNEPGNETTYHALILFALVGAVCMVSYSNLTMLFLGIEILSIPMYVMAGSRKGNLASNEAAFKYLIMGAFATGFLLFGIALIYGATGTFNVSEIKVAFKVSADSMSGLFYVGILMILVAMCFKVSAAPFHFWAPDVYHGAPTEVTAFMATIVKTAAFAAFLRLFNDAFAAASDTWTSVMYVLVLLTLFVGNVTAVAQDNAKRLLAYSSIAHAGFMLLALMANNSYSQSAILYYVIAYSLGTLATFSIVAIVSRHKGSQLIGAFNGLARTNPIISFIMTVSLLSVAGIPPTAGFFAKYYVFTAALNSDYVIIVFAAIIASLVGVYFYFKIVIAMYFKRPSKNENIHVPSYKRWLLVLIGVAIIILGLFPDSIIKLL